MDSKDATNLLSTKTLVKFGLNRQPFMDKGSNRYAFEDSAISTQLNVLINIIHGSDKIVMIKGENGIGKSSLLYKLAKTRHKGLTFCPITATDKITIEGICKIALKQLEIQPPGSNASIPEFFAKRVAFRRRTEGKTVLLIDDADQLDSYTIDQLLLLRKLVAEDGVPAISIVFAGHPQLEQILTALPRINNHLSILHTIYLYPFSEKQTTDYINQRLQFASNNNDVELLTPAQIQSIHNKAKGIPTLINYETCKVLEGMAGNKPAADVNSTEQGDSPTSGKLVPAVLASVALISLAFIGYLVYGHLQISSNTDEPQNIAQSSPTSKSGIPEKKVVPFKPAQPPVTAEPEASHETAVASLQDPSLDPNLKPSQEPEVVAVIPVAEPVAGPIPVATAETKPIATTKPQQIPAKTEPQPVIKEKPIELSKNTKKPETQKTKIETIAVATGSSTTTTQPALKTESKAPISKELTEATETNTVTAANKKADQAAESKTTKTMADKPAVTDAKQKPKQETKIAEKKDAAIKADPVKTAKPAENLTPKQSVQVTKIAKTKPAKAIPETKIKPRPKAVTPVKAKTTVGVTEWIKAQPPLNYTMQLLAAQEESALEKYKAKHPSLKNAKIAHTLRKGKEWYVLIIGSYKTTKEANAFLKKQPKPISTSKPWIRRFKPLQNTLK